MKRLLSLCLLLIGLLAGAPAARGQNALEDEPGYVNPKTIESWFDARPNVEVNLKGSLLRMVVEATKEKKPKVSGLLDRVKAIQVRIFPSDSTRRDAIAARSDQLLDRLEADGWETVVRTREDGENVDIHLKTRGDDAISGLIVLVNEPGEESVFVNIVGDISPEEIGRLGGSLGLGALGGLGADANPDDGK